MTEEEKAASEPKPVPYDRFKEVNDEKNLAKQAELQARQEAADLRKKLDEAEKRPVQDAQPRHTHESLQKSVEEGKLTTQQAQDILDTQFLQETKAAAADAAKSAVSTATLEERQELQFAKYKAAHPDLTNANSEIMQKVGAEYKRLVANGLPDSKATELAALEIAIGPAETLKQTETPTFSGGQGDSSVYSQEQPDSSGIPADLAKLMTAREKSYYTPLIGSAVYPDWKAVGEELKHSNREKAQKNDMMFGKPR